jgi:FkbM family methyltransferase
VGKTHLAIALGIAATETGYRTLYTTAADLVANLQSAHVEGSWGMRMRAYTAPSVLVIQELGYLPMDATSAHWIFHSLYTRSRDVTRQDRPGHDTESRDVASPPRFMTLSGRSLLEPLSSLRRSAWYKLKVFLLDGLLRPIRPGDMVRFGTYYGGWWIRRVDPGKGAAVCIGAGLDVSFDLELLRLGYRVYTADPTPDAIKFVRETAPQLNLIPVGVWIEPGWLEFHRGTIYSEVWSATSLPGADGPVVQSFPVTTVKELLESIDEERIAILKLDIEGAEHQVLRSIVRDRIRPDCVCVEFDDQRLRRVVASVRLMQKHGYDLHQIENWNYTFVRR